MMATDASSSTMKDDGNRIGGPAAKAARDPRQERLKRALRENLKRRKSQARERGDVMDEQPVSEEAVRDDGGESPAE